MPLSGAQGRMRPGQMRPRRPVTWTLEGSRGTLVRATVCSDLGDQHTWRDRRVNHDHGMEYPKHRAAAADRMVVPIPVATGHTC